MIDFSRLIGPNVNLSILHTDNNKESEERGATLKVI